MKKITRYILALGAIAAALLLWLGHDLASILSPFILVAPLLGAVQYPSKGWVLKYGAIAIPNTTIDNHTNVDFNPGARSMINTANHSDTTIKSRIKEPLRDAPQVTFSFLYDPADTIHELLRSHHSAGTKGYLTILAPDSGTAEWALIGYVTDWAISGQDAESGRLEVAITFMADAVETFTA